MSQFLEEDFEQFARCVSLRHALPPALWVQISFSQSLVEDEEVKSTTGFGHECGEHALMRQAAEAAKILHDGPSLRSTATTSAKTSF